MKRILSIFVSLLILSCLSMSAQVERGEKMLGVKAGYVTHNESAVAGLMFRYAVSPWVRIVPEVASVFRHHDEDAFLVDLNVQVPFSFGTKKVDLYPLAGLTFNSWSRHFELEETNQDVSSRVNRFGANLGAGFDFRCTPTLNIGVEARYSFLKVYTSAYFTASISYVF